MTKGIKGDERGYKIAIVHQAFSHLTSYLNPHPHPFPSLSLHIQTAVHLLRFGIGRFDCEQLILRIKLKRTTEKNRHDAFLKRGEEHQIICILAVGIGYPSKRLYRIHRYLTQTKIDQPVVPLPFASLFTSLLTSLFTSLLTRYTRDLEEGEAEEPQESSKSI